MTLREALHALSAGKAICHETWDTDEWVRLTDDGWEWFDSTRSPLFTTYSVGWKIFDSPLTAQETLNELRTLIRTHGYGEQSRQAIQRLLWPNYRESWKP